MAVSLVDLVRHCDAELRSSNFQDYCPNGLQVEGVAEVRRLATAVTANQSVLDAAIAWGADALLVHHGYFWRGEDPCIQGMKRRRIAALLAADMSLIAYHLPLDAHPELGNNAQLGARLKIGEVASLEPGNIQAVGNVGAWPEPESLGSIVARVRELTGREPLLIGDESVRVQRVAWCTGAAQGYLQKAVSAGAQLYISGEISEQTVHEAREQGIAYLAAGHHATERYGVQALGASLGGIFGLDWTFLDCDNPV